MACSTIFIHYNGMGSRLTETRYTVTRVCIYVHDVYDVHCIYLHQAMSDTADLCKYELTDF